MPPAPNKHRCAILDDYQNIALNLGGFDSLAGEVEFTVFNRPLGTVDEIAKKLQGYDMIVITRERTAFPRELIEQLKDVRLIVSTGGRNPSLDVACCRERGITVCNTLILGRPTVSIAIALILELYRHVGYQSEQMKHGAFWQTRLGSDPEGKTLGVIGLGTLGTKVAQAAKALGMRVIAWSQNLTAERCEKAGVEFAGSKDELLRQADAVTLHLVLGPRSRGTIGAREFALMKPTAFIVNTSRGPLIDEPAMIEALRNRTIAGAGLDVYEIEPLPIDHPLRMLDNVVLSPHLGYVTQENMHCSYTGVVEDIRAYLDGQPIRIFEPA